MALKCLMLTSSACSMHTTVRRWQAMVSTAWAACLTWPDIFSTGSRALLLILTTVQLAIFLPLLRKAIARCTLQCLGAGGNRLRRDTAHTERRRSWEERVQAEVRRHQGVHL